MRETVTIARHGLNAKPCVTEAYNRRADGKHRGDNMKKIALILTLLCFGAMEILAQARHGGAGSALNWHEWSSRPEWVKNLDEYDWQYVFNAPLAVSRVNTSMVPRNVIELIDRQVGRGADGMVWAYDAFDSNANVINIYSRSNGIYLWITVSKYWFY